MKKFMLLLLVCVCPLLAQAKKHFWEADYEMAHYKYKESGLMNLKSQHRNGFHLGYTYITDFSTEEASNPPTKLLFGLDFRYMQGDVDYQGGTWGGAAFSADNLTDYYFEAMVRLGGQYLLSEQMDLIIYSGLGWRQLRNHLEESGAGGYLRQSIYLYVPLGLKTAFTTPGQWKLQLALELDGLAGGHQSSHYDNSWGNVHNTQDAGMGFRASLRLTKMLGQVGLFVEPFWHYWKIEDSDIVYVYEPGHGTFGLQEPANSTREYGLKVGLSF